MQDNELNSRLESLKASLQQNKRPSPVLEMSTEQSFNESLKLLIDYYVQQLLINVSENAIDSEGKMVFIGSERIMDEVIKTCQECIKTREDLDDMLSKC